MVEEWQRWKRLEEYARSKWRFRLHALPDEILHYILTSFLTRKDMCNVLTAYQGFEADINQRSDVLSVPHHIRPEWLHYKIYSSVHDRLKGLCEMALFHTQPTHGCVCCGFLDWSPFSGRDPSPVVMYYWSKELAHCDVHVTELCAALERYADKKKPVAQLSFWMSSKFNNNFFLYDRPLRVTEIQLFPHHLTNLY
jgi:hypothetical protein